MDSDKSTRREQKSDSDATGDRRTGSVGERPDLADSRDSGNHGSSPHGKKHLIQDELDGTTGNDPGLGGE